MRQAEAAMRIISPLSTAASTRLDLIDPNPQRATE
jgi:hypothetical protein